MGFLHRTVRLSSGELRRMPRLHLDFFGEEWRRYGAPHRLYVHMPRGTLVIALTPGSRVGCRRHRGGHWITWTAATVEEA